MSLFFPLTLTRIPRTGGYVQGKYSTIDGTSETIKGSFQPANGQELQALPEGRRQRQTFKVYTKTELTAPRQDRSGDETPGDIIEYKNKRYEVVTVGPWENGIINHFKAIIQEEKE